MTSPCMGFRTTPMALPVFWAVARSFRRIFSLCSIPSGFRTCKLTSSPRFSWSFWENTPMSNFLLSLKIKSSIPMIVWPFSTPALSAGASLVIFTTSNSLTARLEGPSQEIPANRITARARFETIPPSKIASFCQYGFDRNESGAGFMPPERSSANSSLISLYPPRGMAEILNSVPQSFFWTKTGPKPSENEGTETLKALQSRKCPHSWTNITNPKPSIAAAIGTTLLTKVMVNPIKIFARDESSTIVWASNIALFFS